MKRDLYNAHDASTVEFACQANFVALLLLAYVAKPMFTKYCQMCRLDGVSICIAPRNVIDALESKREWGVVRARIVDRRPLLSKPRLVYPCAGDIAKGSAEHGEK
jgi:hypothetical protein